MYCYLKFTKNNACSETCILAIVINTMADFSLSSTDDQITLHVIHMRYILGVEIIELIIILNGIF